MNGLETEFSDRINFYRLDANRPEYARIQQDYGLRGHPSVAILNPEGEVVYRYFGAATEEELRDNLNELVP